MHEADILKMLKCSVADLVSYFIAECCQKLFSLLLNLQGLPVANCFAYWIALWVVNPKPSILESS